MFIVFVDGVFVVILVIVYRICHHFSCIVAVAVDIVDVFILVSTICRILL